MPSESESPNVTPSHSASASAGTKGFLFSDLRGYTAFVERAGDQAAAELLSTYRSLVREVIGSHDGAEIKTEGDSFYVVFPNASAAVEAGLSIIATASEQSTQARPIRVGVGVHAGETVATTEGLVGGAVNIAARVCAKAQSGELLVTDTVRALTRTFLPYRYTSLGTQQLKGIAGGIPLFRVEVTPSTRQARLRRQLSARRGRVLVVGGLVVVLIAVGAGVYAANRAPDCLSLSASTKDVVAKIDPARNCVVATYQVGQRPASLVFADEILWVANMDDETLTWIEPQTQHTGATAAGGVPAGLASGPDSVIALDELPQRQGQALAPDVVAHILNSEKRKIAVPATLPNPDLPKVSGPGYSGIAFVGDRGWVSNSVTGQVVRVLLESPTGYTNVGKTWTSIQVETPVQPPPISGHTFTYSDTGVGPIAAGSGAVWLANTWKPLVYRLDGSVATPFSLDGDSGSVAIDVTDRAIWLARTDGGITQVSPQGGPTKTFHVGGEATALAADGTAVWAPDLLGSVVRRVDAATGLVLATIKVGGRPAGIAISPDGSVWVTIQGP